MADRKDSATDQAQRATDAFRQAGEKAAQNGNQISMKILEQAETNTREVFGTMREIAGAKDVSDVMRIQSDFVREQGTRAMNQAKEIGELIAQFGRESVDGLKNKTR